MIKVAAVAKDNNAQIQEKTLIQAKLLERDKHLDKIMNVAIQKTKEVEEKNEKIQKQHVDKIKQNNYEHILQHQINKDLQETKFQLENDKHQEIYDRMKQEDLNVVKEKMKKKQRLGEEMRQIIKEKMEAKERSKEVEKLADMKIVSQGMENLKQLSKRAAPNPKLIELSKKQDLVFAKLEAHNKQKDFKLKEQELSLKRAEETKERELIMKQKDLAEKRAHSNAMLRACLSAQVLFKSQLKKTQADQERAKDKRYIKADQELSKRAAPNPKLIELSKKQDLVFAKLEAHNKQKDFKLKEQELSLKRAEETKERELIMKQKDLAEKRAHSNAMLRACLSAQVLFKSQLKKTQADQERTKDKRYIKADQEEFIKMKKKKLNEENLRNLDILKQQMMNRQLLANARCRKQSEEAKQFIEREQESLMHLNEYKEKVLMDARASGVPEEQLIVFNRNATSLIKKENHCLNLSGGNQ
ncbi:cilia- and flagella-associated protein 45-like [Paralichthys olivaceus]|uniref:cilia- and flagella-associated protein 45-like n=1 Tax=Paralichthys olivaceus TaxID=8255 RepID=UPI003750BDF0